MFILSTAATYLPSITPLDWVAGTENPVLFFFIHNGVIFMNKLPKPESMYLVQSGSSPIGFQFAITNDQWSFHWFYEHSTQHCPHHHALVRDIHCLLSGTTLWQQSTHHPKVLRYHRSGPNLSVQERYWRLHRQRRVEFRWDTCDQWTLEFWLCFFMTRKDSTVFQCCYHGST
jgi:hypothetical protein